MPPLLRSSARLTLLFALLNCICYAQNVLTWHNDINRTGWQQNESVLTPSAVKANFGLIWQYTGLQGAIYAQPLVYTPTVPASGCPLPCTMVLIATEQDMLYAFNANSSSNTPIWSLNLASAVQPGDTWLQCASTAPPPPPNLICGMPNGVIWPDIGVTSTPVIDPSTNTMYVVSLVVQGTSINYHLNAVNVVTGAENFAPTAIGGEVHGFTPTLGTFCGTGSTYLEDTFNPSAHYQRAGLLLLQPPNRNYDGIFVAFAPGGDEFYNGWIFSYEYSATAGFTQQAIFSTTPNGSGGGIWGSGGGLAAAVNSNGSTYLYATTGNGTFDANNLGTPNNDYGDSALQLDPYTLAVDSFFTPSDQSMRCLPQNDLDYGSGGILMLPDSGYAGYPDLMLNAEKESELWVLDRDALGGYETESCGANNDNVVECLVAPPSSGGPVGYWSAPAYWKWTNSQGGTSRSVYYSVRQETPEKGFAPFPINMYTLNTSYPLIPTNGATSSSPDGFCAYGATPSISSNGATGGILWAIEATNTENGGSAQAGYCKQAPKEPGTYYGDLALHAYDATNLAAVPELYDGRGLNNQNPTGYPRKFITPTVSNGKVFVGAVQDIGGTMGMLDVYGLCSNNANGCLK